MSIVISTLDQLEVLETFGALTRPHASPRSGVVSADLIAQYQGTGMPFGGFDATDVAGIAVTPRVRKGAPSGTMTWSPPV
ncbi:hypothetical protein GCM10027446_18790 [Angustibacter peucedani]